jgi:hypothetical protein
MKTVALLMIGLTACGLGTPTVDPAEAPPPDVMANGVPGVVLSYCRTMAYCSDGGIDFTSGDYPGVEVPITLTFQEPIGYITAHVTAPDRDDAPVEMTGVDADARPLLDAVTIGRLPPGDWQVLTIFVGFDGDVTSGVVWELAGPSASGAIGSCRAVAGARRTMASCWVESVTVVDGPSSVNTRASIRDDFRVRGRSY